MHATPSDDRASAPGPDGGPARTTPIFAPASTGTTASGPSAPTVLVGTDGTTVRVATEAELDAAGAAVRDAYAADGHASSEPGYLDTLADARSRAREATLVVAVDPDGVVLGSVTFALPGTAWAEVSRTGETEFRALGVAPAARGRGVGEALTRWCVEESRRLGSRRVVMCSLDTMHSAHRLYRRLGFRRRPDLDWEPVPGVLLLGFALDLDADTGVGTRTGAGAGPDAAV